MKLAPPFKDTTEAMLKAKFLYELQPGEIWTVFEDVLIVAHPDRPPKKVWPDGHVEVIAFTLDENTLHLMNLCDRGAKAQIADSNVIPKFFIMLSEVETVKNYMASKYPTIHYILDYPTGRPTDANE